ncbi:MAG TPA: ATP-binding protein, partial [Polyangiaceae bacterium]
MEQDRYRYFRVEARELLQQMGEGLLSLEKGGAPFEHVPILLRLAHTLKGAARVVKQREIADRAHALEEVLSPFREEKESVPRDRVAQALQLLDASDALLRAIDAPKSIPPGEKPQPRGEVFETVRTDIADVEALLDGLSEAHSQVTAIRKVLGAGERAKALLDVLVEQLTPRAGREISSSPAALQKAWSIADELRTLFGKFERSLGVAVDQADRELGDVRDRTEQLRLVPCRTLFVGLERTARDGAQTAGKAVDFEASGGDIRLDAQVLERIQPALVQLVRNAVAHGIEPGLERGAAGKRTTGKVSLEVLRRGRNVVFRVSDDGRGIDVGAVRRALRSSGRFKELEQLEEGGLMTALLRGGISTSESVTELAGRGIGLDVLRDAVEILKGTASVRTERGVGTTFELMIPPSAASIEMLSVEAGGELVNVPLESVCMAIRVTAEQLTRTGQGSAVAFEGGLIPFLPLATALRRKDEDARTERAWSALVIRGATGLAAVGVDCLRGSSST